MASKRSQGEQKIQDSVLEELARNGYDHVKIEGGAQLGTAVREEDVKDLFNGFQVDKVRLYTHNPKRYH